MTYELAKQLKDAGFPQRHKFIEGVDIHILEPYIPTLDELIEACGEEFYALHRMADDEWYSQSFKKLPTGIYSTRTEAVARLWLVLNKK